MTAPEQEEFNWEALLAQNRLFERDVMDQGSLSYDDDRFTDGCGAIYLWEGATYFCAVHDHEADFCGLQRIEPYEGVDDDLGM